MKTKITFPALRAWLNSEGIEVLKECLASAICTNLYLNNLGVLAVFDNGTVSLQGKPPVEFINAFKKLCGQELSHHNNAAEPQSAETDAVYIDDEDSDCTAWDYSPKPLPDFSDHEGVEKTSSPRQHPAHKFEGPDDGW